MARRDLTLKIHCLVCGKRLKLGTSLYAIRSGKLDKFGRYSTDSDNTFGYAHKSCLHSLVNNDLTAIEELRLEVDGEQFAP